jgi:hypothetical protein
MACHGMPWHEPSFRVLSSNSFSPSCQTPSARGARAFVSGWCDGPPGLPREAVSHRTSGSDPDDDIFCTKLCSLTPLPVFPGVEQLFAAKFSGTSRPGEVPEKFARATFGKATMAQTAQRRPIEPRRLSPDGDGVKPDSNPMQNFGHGSRASEPAGGVRCVKRAHTLPRARQ